MFELLRRNPLAVLLAVAMHGLLLAFMVVGVDWRKPPKPQTEQVEIIHARVLDESKLAAQVEKLKAAERRQQTQSEAARKKEEKRLAELKKQREREKKRLAELERKRKLEEEKRKDAEAKRKLEEKRQQEAETKRKAEEAKAKAAAEQRLKEEAERKRQAAEAEAERKRKAAEAEAERKRKAAAEAAAKAKAEQAAREAQLARQFEAEQDAQEKGSIIAAIQQKVARNWLRPPGAAEQGLKCVIRVRLGSSGSVLLVQVVESSGNGAFDRSAEAAVRKADPLPMPTSPRLQALFRDFKFEFDPAKSR